MRAYRIADRRWPILDGTGAALYGGRWNSAGRPVIYAATSFACAMLERLAQTGTGRVPKNQVVVVIDLPKSLAVEDAPIEVPPSLPESRALGDRWLAERRTIALTVPSVISHYDRDVLINPAHPEFGRVQASEPQDAIWDARLFRHGE